MRINSEKNKGRNGVTLKSKNLRDSANGQDCTLNIAGVCNYDSSTVVLCHFPDESKGIGKKSDDISSGFGCSCCHDVVDGRRKSVEWDSAKNWYMRRAQTRTLRKWIEMGIVEIKGIK